MTLSQKARTVASSEAEKPIAVAAGRARIGDDLAYAPPNLLVLTTCCWRERVA